ncbi:uncharacterized protein LOC123395652 isoform X1 [Hordeum vulgare subsp. vulgare]|uniref:uncharacterized protein LOC123395652 isoform X1 n=1 Tax=Hordeum vulgare subsp. vulgare TaxID=112509 RepID=UPI001D1A4129|nr:uncharacterized protein LOC123395652 isoform X1 [Hordeum vulgare subsp. vulgare]
MDPREPPQRGHPDVGLPHGHPPPPLRRARRPRPRRPLPQDAAALRFRRYNNLVVAVAGRAQVRRDSRLTGRDDKRQLDMNREVFPQAAKGFCSGLTRLVWSFWIDDKAGVSA